MPTKQSEDRSQSGAKARRTPEGLPCDEILVGDCVAHMRALPAKTIDCIFADPPYNMQLGGELLRTDGSRVDGVDDAWDRFESVAAYDAFSKEWLGEARRILADDGTIWVIGSYHCIYRLGYILQELGFWILNDIHWIKTNPMPNFAGRRFQNATETMLWASKSRKARYTFNHHLMKGLNDGLQMRNTWEIPICSGRERLVDDDGRKLHSTQKPEALLFRVLSASTNPGDLVLDPFFGTGTTGAVARRLGRHFIGIEREPRYAEAARRRIAKIPPTSVGEELLAVGSKRRERQVVLATLLEEGWIEVGAELVSKTGRKARLRADGKIVSGTLEGSIHSVGKAVGNRPSCNGWEFWFFEEGGRLLPLDELRRRRQSALEAARKIEAA